MAKGHLRGQHSTMNCAFRPSCRIQPVADAVAVGVPLAVQIILLYLLWVKDQLFIPPELVVAGFIETVLVTLLLQIAALAQLCLLVLGLHGFCANRMKIKNSSGTDKFRLDREFIKDLFFGVLYIPLCLGGSFLTAAASRPWHSKPFEGGVEIFLRILSLVAVVLLVILGVYVIYRGSRNPLMQSPLPQPVHVLPVSTTRCPLATEHDLTFITIGLLLLPVYTLLAVYPYSLFALLKESEIHTVLDIAKLRTSITSVAASLTGSCVLLLFCVMGFQTRRRWRARGRPQPPQSVRLYIMYGP